MTAARIRALAKRVQADTEARDIIIVQPPMLTRMNKVYYTGKDAKAEVWVYRGRITIRPFVQQIRKAGGRITRMEKNWHVHSYNTSGQTWQNYAVAMAHLEGLRFHYARWLLAKGTKAERYV